jgi:ubiquinone/menaquinone biosynthesis C-methylase UbiE
VLGVDKSVAVIDEASKRSARTVLPVEFEVGDLHALRFPNESFDRSRSDRTFQHLDEPLAALSELVRVTRPGGRVVVSDIDWETLVVDASPHVTRHVANSIADATQNGWIGRQLPRMFRAAGLEDVGVVPETIVFTDHPVADHVLSLSSTAERVRQTGMASSDAVDAWLDELRKASEAGVFFAAVSGFMVCGIKR